MTTSDFLVILSILVALVAITVANNKKLWLYKFSSLSWVIGGIWAVLVNFLIFYESLRDKGMPAILEFSWGIRADYWGYFLSVFGLLGLMIYVGKGKHFPKSNWENVLNYYRDLITENPSLLVGIIERYHLRHIKCFIKDYNELSKVETSSYEENNIVAKKSVRSKISAMFKIWEGDKLSERVWSEILLTEEFISQCARVHPLFLLRIFSQYHGDNIPDGKRKIQLFFRELIKSKHPVFLRELDEFFNHENKPVVTQSQTMAFFKHILQKDILWFTKYEIVFAIGEEAEKEISTEWSSFSKRTDEWDTAKYHQSICYQCLQLYAIQYMYLSEFMSGHPNYQKDIGPNHREWLPYSHTMARICKAIARQTPESGTFADKYIDDCREMIYDVLGYVGEKYSDYVSSLLQCNLDITRVVKQDDPICIPKDSTIVAMEHYICLVEYQNLNDKGQKEYLNYLMKKKINMVFWEEALVEVEKKYGEKRAFTQLKQLFTQNEKCPPSSHKNESN